jgi:hypothetical protein
VILILWWKGNKVTSHQDSNSYQNSYSIEQSLVVKGILFNYSCYTLLVHAIVPFFPRSHCVSVLTLAVFSQQWSSDLVESWAVTMVLTFIFIDLMSTNASIFRCDTSSPLCTRHFYHGLRRREPIVGDQRSVAWVATTTEI